MSSSICLFDNQSILLFTSFILIVQSFIFTPTLTIAILINPIIKINMASNCPLFRLCGSFNPSPNVVEIALFRSCHDVSI